MFYFHSSLGIDFRGDHMNIAHLVRTFKGLSLADSECLEPIYDHESSTEERYKLLFEDLRRFLNDRKISPDSVVLGLPRNEILFKFINIPKVPRDEVKSVLEYELELLFPYPSEELFYDYKIIKESEDEGMKILIIAIPKKNLDILFENLHELDIKLSAINTASIALVNLHNFNKKFTNGSGSAIFLNFENDCVEITASSKDDFYVAKSCKFKQGIENNQNVEEIVRHIEQIEDQIISENEEELPEKIFISGKTQAYRELLLDIETRSDLKFEDFEPYGKIKKNLNEYTNGKFTSAISLALQGFADVKYDTNILPTSMRVKKRSYGPVIMVALLSIILILVSGIMIRLSVRERLALKEIKTKQEKSTDEANIVKETRKKIQDYISYIESFNEIVTSDVSKLHILKELSNIIPNTEENLIWLTRLEINGDELQINGYAESSEGLLVIFENSPFFRNARFEGTTTKGRDEKERFTLKAKIISPESDVYDKMEEYDQALANPAKFMELEMKSKEEEKKTEKPEEFSEKMVDNKNKKNNQKKKKSSLGDMIKRPVTGY